MLMEGGDHNMIGLHSRGIRDHIADTGGKNLHNTEKIGGDDNQGILAVAYCHGIEIYGIEYSLCKSDRKISGKLAAQRRGNVQPRESCFEHKNSSSVLQNYDVDMIEL
jgi:hypothetical protein